jgi:hypothetical protein
MKPQVSPPKKPYKSPKLSVYGDLTEMTQTMFAGGMADGGGSAIKKTGGG